MEPQVIAIDPYVIAFIKHNWLSITLLISLLKGLAILTPGTTDDKIVTLISNLLNTVRPNNKSQKEKIDNTKSPVVIKK